MTDVKLKFVMPSPEHQALRDELYEVLVKHADMRTHEMIGVVGQLLGHVLAVTGTQAGMEAFLVMVNKNIVSGYESARLQTEAAQGNA